MNEIHELKELEHKIEEAMNRPPDTRDEETLAEYEDNVIQDGLFGIRELSEMKPETERTLLFGDSEATTYDTCGAGRSL